jgi:Lon protease-like protein
MNNQKLKLPLFPLSLFILPQGIARLRIFEPKYLKMISKASQGEGFVITSFNEMKSDLHKVWGSWVEIIDFNQGRDGVLEIDVRCKSLINFHAIDKHSDGLLYGEVTLTDHWLITNNDALTNKLSNSLKSVIKNDPMLTELYANESKVNPRWVVSRWLELLPADMEVKSTFIDKQSFERAKGFIQSIIYKTADIQAQTKK